MTATRIPGSPARPTAPRGSKRTSTPGSAPSAEHNAPGAVVAVKRIFAAESANYFLLLGTTLFLVAFGLVMVLSSSSIDSYKANGGNAFTDFFKQGLYALIGVPLLLVASRMSPEFWKKWAWVGIGLTMGLQLLVFVPGVGITFQGNTNWIHLGPVTAQPSELVKIGLIVWTGYIISRKQELLSDWRHVVVPVAPVAGLAILLVLAGNDLGTAVMMLGIVFGCLFFAGVKLRHLIVAALVIGFVGFVFSATGASRSSRISQWLTGCESVDTSNACWQPVHGMWALASGGIFGVGLGNSKMKWSWLPAAENDYIFAIIGEELGLIGAIVVLILFVVLAIALVRVFRSTTDSFGRIVTGGVMVWIIGQALVNIAVVLGLLPVLGVPLPLISAGGSALISGLFAVGVVLSIARQPHGKREAPVGQSPADRSRLAAATRVRL